jgi:serine/threonine protein kinase/dipeptidyl aminopeptidase/acylaminoacyl peptidase
MPIEAGAKFDRYQILAQIGKGGMGEVYLAQDPRLNRKVALKLLPAQYTEDPERLRRFEQEAQAASALNHPNIVTIYEIGEADGRPYIATEYIEGLTLRRKMARERLPIEQLLGIAMQVVGALSAAHSAGIVHRDIKPENIMIRPDGYVKMLDFGLAKLTEKFAGGEPFQPVPDTGEVVLDDSRETGAPAAPPPDTNPPGNTADAFVTVAGGGSHETVPGIVMGTAQYMSPEQARGHRVDSRTDLFSFGIVLYEMLAGRAPFSGTTPRQIIDSILSLDPAPVSHLNADTPEVLEWIVTKSLVKDREERYQSAKEMLNDLRRLHHRLDGRQGDWFRMTGPAPSPSTPSRSSGQSTLAIQTQSGQTYSGGIKNTLTSALFANWQQGSLSLRHNRPFLITLGSLLAVILSFAGYLMYQSRARIAGPFASIEVKRFTTSGKANRAAISPDGKLVVHVHSEGGKQGLLMRQVMQSNYIEVVPPAEVIYRGLTFSRDGATIFYVVQEGANPIQSLYQVPVLGNTPRRILTNIDSPVAISPDSKQLAFVRRYRGKNEDALIVCDLNGQHERTLATRRGADFFGVSGAAFSPDGKFIACPAGTNTGGRQMYLAEVAVADGRERPVSAKRWGNLGRVTWQRDGRGLLVSAIEQGSNLAQVWHAAYPNGQARRITSDLNDYRDMSLSDDSRALVTVQSEAHVNIWLMPAGNQGADSARARKITDGIGQYNGVGGLTWLPDGRIVYVSRASGSQDVWLMNADGSNARSLTAAETRADRYTAVSPDGRYVVFVSTRTGSSNLYRYDLQTGEQVQLTKGTSEEFPAVSADGKWVIYTATGSIKFTLWKIPITGGEPVRLTDQLSQWPAISPDGQRIACWYRADAQAKWQIAILSMNGGAPEQILDVPAAADTAIPVRWMPDSKGISYVATQTGIWNVWNLPLDGGPPKQLTQFGSDQIFWFDWSRDGKQLACSRGTVTSDVVLINEFKP